jgi:hypothetical protein
MCSRGGVRGLSGEHLPQSRRSLTPVFGPGFFFWVWCCSLVGGNVALYRSRPSRTEATISFADRFRSTPGISSGE